MASPKTAAAIPPISEIRNSLHYGDARLVRCVAFYDDIRVFRKKFITKANQAGTDFIDWRKPEHRFGLLEMAGAYLDSNGELFWPHDPSHPNYNGLCYADSRQQIKGLLKQLFFRLNLQQYRNDKYKHKKDRQTTDSSNDNRQGSKDNPIDLNSQDADSQSTGAPDPPGHDRSPGSFQTSFRVSLDQRPAVVDPNLPPAPEPQTTTEAAQEQPGPLPGPALSDAPPTTASRFAPITPVAAEQTQQSVEEPATGEPPPKRAKHHEGTTRSTKSAKKSHRPKPKIEPKPRSLRQRKQRHDPNSASREAVNAACSPSSTPSLPTPRDNRASIHPHANTPSHAPRVPPFPTVEEDESNDYIRETLSHFSSLYPRDSPAPVAEMAASLRSDSVALPRTSEAQESRASLGRLEIRDSRSAGATVEPTNTPETVHGTGENETANPSREPSMQTSANREPNRQELTPTSRPKFAFSYRAVQSRTPLEVISWTPKGKFSQMTLPELEGQIPLQRPADAKGWLLTLIGPDLRIKMEVPYGQDDQFKDVQKYFEALIRKAIAQNREQSRVAFAFEIEVLHDESLLMAKKDEEVFEGELDF